MRTINVIDYNDFPKMMGVKLAVVEVSKKNACEGCIFYKEYGEYGKCTRNESAAKAEEMQCVAAWRYDGKDVIYREATEEEVEKFN